MTRVRVHANKHPRLDSLTPEYSKTAHVSCLVFISCFSLDLACRPKAITRYYFLYPLLSFLSSCFTSGVFGISFSKNHTPCAPGKVRDDTTFLGDYQD